MRRVVFGIWFLSMFYFIIYAFMPGYKALVNQSGALSILHAIMGIILMGGLFIYVVTGLHHFFTR
ncbi:hypothetical protein AYR54_00510 [Loigolactobacillus backii]|uniref:hypothetical protein n=1 Tax=Loigolactobacillus TaxID=2767889 RepID=UPI0007F0D2DE|nr:MULTISPECIES: hypothetical protein [Loigolactobacillus]ANK58879.1 hypothetical protein AYR52_00520 [Loigolactobacillus backii]ANK63868.1 hypothetical protein AYR54_00510 [Loigolactobacillus backii]ANK66316.1 hypothetical protein AYR55_00515 [Loigolactobacillus backii]OLF68200.1 hypothetical protein ACX53_12045 [Loigolactobacillus backii]PIO86407.1 hypothetical protein B8A32_04185 [Loigolactobacillus backii]